MGTQVLIKSEGRHIFKEALIDKTQTDCRQTEQRSRKTASLPLFQWENDRGYLAQRAAVRLISENGICLKAEMILSVPAATNCYNLGPYPAHCVFSQTDPLYTSVVARIYSLMLSACPISSNSRNAATFLTALGKSNTELSFTLRLHGSNSTERNRGTARRKKSL